MAELPHHDDPLGEALQLLRMTGAFYCRSELTAPWALQMPPLAHCLMFHIVTAGQCLLEVPGAETCVLRPGDLTLVAQGAGHLLSNEPGVAPVDLIDAPREVISNRYEILRHGDGGALTTMVCAVVQFDHPVAHQLLGLLPKLIRIDTWQSPQSDWVQSTLRFITSEAQQLKAGGETVITRLADILVIQAIRAWIASDPAAQMGWLGALRDKQIGRAISLIHRDPCRRWTLELLANAAGMSRSAFSARFTGLVGKPVMQYALTLKMHAALLRLKQTDVALAVLASDFGYESEAAFSRAFKRVVGTAPGAARHVASPIAWPAS